MFVAIYIILTNYFSLMIFFSVCFRLNYNMNKMKFKNVLFFVFFLIKVNSLYIQGVVNILNDF